MKKCYKCNQEKSLVEFSKDSSKKDNCQSRCKECHKQIIRQHYQDNKEKYVASHKASRRNRQQIVNEKKSVPCIDCGEYHPHWIMQFDHLFDKEMGISRGFKQRGIKWLIQEMDKCEVVCANCHADRTYQRMILKG